MAVLQHLVWACLVVISLLYQHCEGGPDYGYQVEKLSVFPTHGGTTRGFITFAEKRPVRATLVIDDNGERSTHVFEAATGEDIEVTIETAETDMAEHGLALKLIATVVRARDEWGGAASWEVDKHVRKRFSFPVDVYRDNFHAYYAPMATWADPRWAPASGEERSIARITTDDTNLAISVKMETL